MKKAKLVGELEAMRERMLALESERVALERTCENDEVAAELIATARERDRLLGELQEALERRDAARRESAKAAFERDRLLGEIEQMRDERDAALREATADRETVIAALKERLATVSRARDRLFEGNVRVADARMRLEALARERAEAIERLEAERDDVYVVLSAQRSEHEQTLQRLESRLAKVEYERDGAQLQLATITADFERFKAESRDRDAALEHAERRLAEHIEMVHALTTANRQANESLESLQRECLRLEYDVASRVGAAEANLSRAMLSASRLREERSLLIETLELREKRIAVLDTALREIAHEMIRTAQAERDRYLALHNGLLTSKIVAMRLALGALLARPRAIRTRLLGSVTRRPKKRRTPPGSGKRPRHLRSA